MGQWSLFRQCSGNRSAQIEGGQNTRIGASNASAYVRQTGKGPWFEFKPNINPPVVGYGVTVETELFECKIHLTAEG